MREAIRLHINSAHLETKGKGRQFVDGTGAEEAHYILHELDPNIVLKILYSEISIGSYKLKSDMKRYFHIYIRVQRTPHTKTIKDTYLGVDLMRLAFMTKEQRERPARLEKEEQAAHKRYTDRAEKELLESEEGGEFTLGARDYKRDPFFDPLNSNMRCISRHPCEAVVGGPEGPPPETSFINRQALIKSDCWCKTGKWTPGWWGASEQEWDYCKPTDCPSKEQKVERHLKHLKKMGKRKEGGVK